MDTQLLELVPQKKEKEVETENVAQMLLNMRHDFETSVVESFFVGIIGMIDVDASLNERQAHTFRCMMKEVSKELTRDTPSTMNQWSFVLQVTNWVKLHSL